MLRRPVAATVLVAVLGLAVFAPARSAGAAAWVRVRTAHFTVSGNVGERRAREVAMNLEQFRQVLLRIFPNARLAVRPLFVVAFDSEKAYAPFKPLHDGKPAPVTGYFTWNSDGSCVTLQLDRGEESYPVVYHEYAHLFLSGASRNLPLWVNEGLAEYYSTTLVVKQGQEAHIGVPVNRHVLFLRGRGLMVLRDLITTTESSKLWNRAEDSALFYAEAWALVHQLASQPDGGAKLAAFIDKVASGRPDVEAFEETFGPLTRVESALQHYIQNGIYAYGTVRTRAHADLPSARAMSAAEVEATEAVILVYLQRYDEAASHVGAALKADPNLVEAHVAAGLLARRQGREAESEKAFRAAVARAPTDLDAAYYWGLSLLEMPNADAASLEQARAGLAAALPADGPPADALAVLGVLQGQCNRLDEAETLLRRSMRLMPGQTRTTAGLADILIRQAKYDEARRLLGPMIARPAYPGEADIGRRLMRFLAEAEMRTRLRDELARLSAAAPSADTSRPKEPPAAADLRGARGLSPGYRVTGAGEARRTGLLEEIECHPEGIVLQVKTTSGPMRLYATRFDAVEFITYREDLTGAVTCGPQPEVPAVFVTWKPVEGALAATLGKLAGRVVAVEFLPK